MRGRDKMDAAMFYAIDVEAMVPADHPLRAVRELADGELRRMRKAFDGAYARVGRPSIPPERLIKALLLQALYSVRSERALCEQIGYNLLFRWFLGMSPEERVWDHSTFSANRKRLDEHRLMERFFEGTVARAVEDEWIGCEAFSVDGTLVQAWGSMKSVAPKDDDGPHDNNKMGGFTNERRGNRTHESKTDPEARLARKGKGQGARLAHSLHALMDNAHGLLVGIEVDEANGHAERENAEKLLTKARRRHGLRPERLGEDAGYDSGEHLSTLEREYGVEPHTAIRRGAIKDQGERGQARHRARRRSKTARGKAMRRARMAVEPIFGWMKQYGGLRRSRFVGRWKLRLCAHSIGAAYNLLRMANLNAAA